MLLKGIGFYIGIFALIMVSMGIIDVSGILWESKIGVWRANVDRNIFEQTKSYNQGQIQQLERYHHEWITSDSIGKKAIEATVRSQFSDFNQNNISDPVLYGFLRDIRAK